ncbi:peptidoglycan-binding protein [Streptomyces rochei]|uniref:peptidoglycan-binding protein n=1 Tax=Streptomyces rochei TaxID=1928 RepID=UPI0036883A58
MTHDRESRNAEQPGTQLARLLRRWWEEAGGPSDGRRPTQQALAARLGIDQTTLSRYLNPRHNSTAPPRIVEALHTHLRAPATELDRARALSRAALEDTNRQRPSDPAPPHTPTDATPDTPTANVTPPAADTVTATVTPDAPTPDASTAGAAVSGVTTDGPAERGRRSGRARPLLALALTALLSFAAGLYVDQRQDPTGPAATGAEERAGAGGAAVDRDGTAEERGGATADQDGAAADQDGEKWPLLYMGTEAVDEYARGRALQYLLQAHGYDLRADGRFGEATHEAVMDFQEKNHLQADGKVGDRTWPELLKQVGPGAEGPAVRAVQDLLNNVGLGATPVSGKFTAATAEDLKHFQRTHRLQATGRTDRATWLALLVDQRPPVSAPEYQRAPVSRPPVSPA